MMWLCYFLGAAMFGALSSYVLLEIHYFMRMLLAFFLSLFKKKAHILDECTMTGEFFLFFLFTFSSFSHVMVTN